MNIFLARSLPSMSVLRKTCLNIFYIWKTVTMMPSPHRSIFHLYQVSFLISSPKHAILTFWQYPVIALSSFKWSLLQPFLLCQIRWSTLLQSSASHSGTAPISWPAFLVSSCYFSSQHMTMPGPHLLCRPHPLQRWHQQHPEWSELCSSFIHQKPIRTSQLCGLICSHLVLQKLTM